MDAEEQMDKFLISWLFFTSLDKTVLKIVAQKFYF